MPDLNRSCVYGIDHKRNYIIAFRTTAGLHSWIGDDYMHREQVYQQDATYQQQQTIFQKARKQCLNRKGVPL